MKIVVNLDVMMARRKMSLGELAQKVDITMANLSILKNNKARAIRFSTLEAICAALDCQPGDILEFVPEVTLYPAGEGRVQTVEFLCGGWGVGPSTSYWGISHVPSDVLTGFQGAALSGWEPWDGGWLWREAGGDNRCFVRRLEPGWFCFEMRF